MKNQTASAWIQFLKKDPRPELLKTNNIALKYFIQRDLCDQTPDSELKVSELPEVKKISKKQQENGAWPDPQHKKHIDSSTNYLMVETYRALGILIDLYGMDKNYPAIQNAAEFLYTTQTIEGDFRGIYGVQYAPNYSGGILELLVKAGYVNDDRIDRAFKWYISVQQHEGGWTAPLQTHQIKMQDCEKYSKNGPLLQFEPEKPFAHFMTGIVLRAFAAHPTYRHHPDALRAGELITHRFFKEDIYSAYKAASCWEHYSIPFWWNDYIAVLDALSKMGISRQNSGITAVLNLFQRTQTETGLWDLHLLKGKGIVDLNLWGNLILCRVIKRFFEPKSH